MQKYIVLYTLLAAMMHTSINAIVMTIIAHKSNLVYTTMSLFIGIAAMFLYTMICHDNTKVLKDDPNLMFATYGAALFVCSLHGLCIILMGFGAAKACYLFASFIAVFGCIFVLILAGISHVESAARQ